MNAKQKEAAEKWFQSNYHTLPKGESVAYNWTGLVDHDVSIVVLYARLAANNISLEDVVLFDIPGGIVQ